MEETNPFLTLCLSPERVRLLRDGQISSLVEDTYRSQAKITHPDREGGSAERFGQVTAAYDEIKTALADPEKLELLKARYLRKRRPQPKPAGAALAGNDSSSALFDFLEGWAMKSQNDKSRIFDLSPLTLLVSDVISAQFASRTAGGSFISAPKGQSGMFNLLIDGKGNLTRQQVGRCRLDIQKQGKPPWPELWWKNNQLAVNSYYWGSDGPPEKLDGLILLGTIDADLMTAQDEPIRRFAGLLEGSSKRDSYQNVMAGSSWEGFKVYARLMSPTIKEASFLVGGRLDADGCLLFHLLGRILALHRGILSKWPAKSSK